MGYAMLGHQDCLADMHGEILTSCVNIKLMCVHPYMYTHVMFKTRKYIKVNSSASVHLRQQDQRDLFSFVVL